MLHDKWHHYHSIAGCKTCQKAGSNDTDSMCRLTKWSHLMSIFTWYHCRVLWYCLVWWTNLQLTLTYPKSIICQMCKNAPPLCRLRCIPMEQWFVKAADKATGYSPYKRYQRLPHSLFTSVHCHCSVTSTFWVWWSLPNIIIIIATTFTHSSLCLWFG